MRFQGFKNQKKNSFRGSYLRKYGTLIYKFLKKVPAIILPTAGPIAHSANSAKEVQKPQTQYGSWFHWIIVICGISSFLAGNKTNAWFLQFNQLTDCHKFPHFVRQIVSIEIWPSKINTFKLQSVVASKRNN